MAKLYWCCALLLLAATGSRAESAPAADSAVERGRYLARAADCVACHTASDGEEFAGGRPIATPIGRIYSTNITPDAATGIGSYSVEDFSRAVREGIAKDGHYLYPAMPFPAYAKISAVDIADLYAYFQHGVAPVKHANHPSAIPFPLSFRFPLYFWDMFVRRGSFQPNPARDAQWNRGAYLVQGLGHCGTCHSPRALTLHTKALTERDGPAFLAGADINGWYAKNLRGDPDGLGRWSDADIVAFLKTGVTDRNAAFGDMAEVVQHSTQYLADDDLTAIARYLKSLPGERAAPSVAANIPTNSSSNGGRRSHGSFAYEEFCVTCHRADGGGVAHIFPALAGNDVVETADVTSLVHIIVGGGRRPQTAARPNAFAMPAFNKLDDREVAEIVTYIRTAWSASAGAVTTDQVAKIRATVGLAMAALSTPPAQTPAKQQLQAAVTVKLAPPRLADIPDDEREGSFCSADAFWPRQRSSCRTMLEMP